MHRREFLTAAIGLGFTTGSMTRAQAQAFPSRPVRLVVGFAAGGPTDVLARVLADLLSARWGGRPTIVENRPGAGTILATAAVAKAAPDGYTLLMATPQFLINQAVGQKLPYDAINDFAPISMVAVSATVLVANKSYPANTVAEIVAEAKKSDAPINFASPGPRGAAHLAGEMLQQRAGIKMQHINYSGSAPALTDVIAGRVPLMFDPWQSSKPHVDAGQLKLIATASAERLRDVPQVPTIAETFPGFSVSSGTIVVGPAGMPEPIQQQLSADIRAVVGSPEFAAKMGTLGLDPRSMSPQELAVFVRQEIDNWTQVAKAANIKPD